MKNNPECIQLQYVKLMANDNIKDIKAAWSAGVNWGKHLSKNTIKDSTAPDFYTWIHEYFIEEKQNDKNK